MNLVNIQLRFPLIFSFNEQDVLASGLRLIIPFRVGKCFRVS